MTIGEKIKYFRTRMGITQAKLAEISGIHPVSIRKYETNKMVPQSAQIDRIADALGISSFAIAGIENNIRLETIGDFMGVLIMLCKTHIIELKGDREENGSLNAETISFVINPSISKFFLAENEKESIDANKILYKLKSEHILKDFINWERINNRYEKCAAESDTYDKDLQNILEQLKEPKEAIEMELQRSEVLLSSDDDVSVRITPISLD